MFLISHIFRLILPQSCLKAASKLPLRIQKLLLLPINAIDSAIKAFDAFAQGHGVDSLEVAFF
jgi:hypothetical protein